MVSDALIGVVRTVVPVLVGACIAWLITAGYALEFDEDPQLSVALIVLCTMIYYGVLTLLERRLSRHIGWLLGFPIAPAYGYGTTTPRGEPYGF